MASELCRRGACGCALTLLVYGIWHPYTRACRALELGLCFVSLLQNYTELRRPFSVVPTYRMAKGL